MSPSAIQDEINFDFEKCLDYVKSGVEAIIEDDVTSRFEAEELKNWNMLTRTNRHYEFISWKITLIWMVGFFIRYVFLMPLRVLVCFVGVSVIVWFNGFLHQDSTAENFQLFDVGGTELTSRILNQNQKCEE